MQQTITKFLIATFYKANTGLFLFFFFIFFGSVQGGTLIGYHASLLKSILGSPVILAAVCFFWILYEAKCIMHIFKNINSTEGIFLYNLQVLSTAKQAFLYAFLQLSLYAPVLAYAAIAAGYGFTHHQPAMALTIILFTITINSVGSYLIYRRINNWLSPPRQWRFGIILPKPFSFYLLYHFLYERKMMMGGIKILSVILLYIVLQLNAGKNDNDSFLLFYLVILLAHFIFSFLAVQFLEDNLSFHKNLPLGRVWFAGMYIFTYAALLLPELIYLLLYGRSLLPIATIFWYYGVSIASLFFLTAVQYSEAMNRDEFMKVGFALFFVSIFMLHVKAFLLWTVILLSIGGILFWAGFYSRSADSEQET